MAARKLVFALSVLICFVGVPYLLRRWQGDERTMALPAFPLRAALICAVVAYLTVCAGVSQIDDSYIYDRYVAHALAGHGLVYNLGEHVNALSSPVFAYLLLLGSWLAHGNVLLASEVLSALGMLAASLLAEFLVPFAGLLLAGTAYFYALTGMETTVFAAVLMLEVVLYAKGQYRWLPLVSVLMALTRFEGAVLVAVIAVRLFRRKELPKVAYFIPAVLLVAGYLLLNKRYYEVYLPSSAMAKLGQGFSGYWGRWPTAFLGLAGIGWLHTLFGGVIYATPVLLGLAFAGVIDRRSKALGEVALPFCAVLFLIYAAMNMPGDYFWYLGPFVLFALVYVASAIPHTRLGLAVAGVFICLNVFQTGRLLRHFKPKPYYYDYVEAGRWFQENTPKTARVGAVEIGLLGWSSDRYIYDAIGLTTPKNAAYVSRHDSNAWFLEDRPDYVFVHAKPWYWENVAKNSSDYVPVSVPLTAGDVILRRKDYQPDLAGTGGVQKP